MLKYTSNLVSLLVLMKAVTFAIANLYLPSFPKIAEYFSVSKTEVQFTLSLYFLGLFVFTFLSNFCVSFFGIRKTLRFGCIFFILSSIVTIFSEDMLWLKVSLVCLAIGVGPMAILSRAFMGSIGKNIRRKVISTVYLFATLIASMAAPLIGGLISFFVWWQFVFVISALFGVVILYRVTVFFRNNPDYSINRDGSIFEYVEILSNKSFLYFFGMKWLLYSASLAFYVELPFILNNHGFNAKDIGNIILLIGTGFIVGSFLSRIFVMYLQVKRVLIVSLIISLLGGVGLAYQVLEYDLYFLIFSAWVLMVGIGTSSSSLTLLVINSLPVRYYEKMSTLYTMITLLVFFIITSAIGYISNYSSHYFYALFIVLPLLSSILFLYSKLAGCFKKK